MRNSHKTRIFHCVFSTGYVHDTNTNTCKISHEWMTEFLEHNNKNNPVQSTIDNWTNNMFMTCDSVTHDDKVALSYVDKNG